MNYPMRRPMTLQAFLDWEERQELRYEFDGFQPVAMTGGTAAHAAIQRNMAVALHGRLRGRPCRFYGSDLKIEVAGRVRYPDGFVVCTPVLPQDKIVREPVVIFEILSTGTASTDIIIKNQEYAATTSVRRYIILSQNEIGGTMFERSGSDWIGHILTADSVIDMPEIGVAVPMAEFYEEVAFGDEIDGAAASPEE